MVKKTTAQKKAAPAHAGRDSRSRTAPPARARKTESASPEGRLPRSAKGKRTTFYPDPDIDALLAIATALTAEVSVAFDRIATLERLLEKRNLLPAGAVESYEPDEAEITRRSEFRDALIERVFRVMSADEDASAPRSRKR
jgi:hypothetical protein